MSASPNSNRDRSSHLHVPRDQEVDRPAESDRQSPRSAADVNQPDEDYTDQDKPLVAGSAEAKALHDHPPKTKGTLGVGTAGDAARPAKPGIHNKPAPPRGKM